MYNKQPYVVMPQDGQDHVYVLIQQYPPLFLLAAICDEDYNVDEALTQLEEVLGHMTNINK